MASTKTKVDLQELTTRDWIAHMKNPSRGSDHHVIAELEQVAKANRQVAKNILAKISNIGLPKPLVRRLQTAVAA